MVFLVYYDISEMQLNWYPGIQAKVERSEYSKSTDTSHDLETTVSELELESIGFYNNGSSHFSYNDKDINWEVSMYSRGASPPSKSEALNFFDIYYLLVKFELDFTNFSITFYLQLITLCNWKEMFT